MSKVLVTGATGFVAGHVIEDLLRSGHEVRATVRSLRDPARFAHLDRIRDALGGRLELVEADLSDDAGWDAAVAGRDHVLHVASPFPPTPPRHEAELIRPAVDGTLRVLEASARAGVRRVVVTSSVAAVAAGRSRDESRQRTEEDWSDLDRAAPYPKSKTLAERAAWRFAAEHPDLEVVTVNPGLVLGPLHHVAAGTSVALVRRILNHEMPAIPELGFAPVDVRDVARAHRLAMEVPGAAGNRYICAGDNMWLADMARILSEEFGPQGYRVPRRPMPYWMLWAVGRFDREVRLGLDFVGSPERVSADKARSELGWSMRPLRTTVTDTGRSLIELGLVRSRQNGATRQLR
ncbi:nucleoside-diphosphate-sugar epimerase [Promicromonospora sp. AC04]|uniref:NAD-dependent epimerase/dehydratase family protein n=1 Tax=Promicromonospora sp. AC04 TaxID=2135723 RepID=UPI000D3A6D40|nr:NAD-dependent epimerase/dehydratase family protein [Promicromonospora sp. AC04]PUB32082.1 nucleoside-diphosphate-sugar epimerase [Promicromonospora sp. AC04]